jgi:hypothetical protein
MVSDDTQARVEFTVRSQRVGGLFNVFEGALDQPIAQFYDIDTAQNYALRMAESESNWKVYVYDITGQLASTYHSDDGAVAGI